MGFMMQSRPEVLAKIQEDFPAGSAVEVIYFHDQYRDVPAGTRGRVLAADDCSTLCIVLSRTMCPWGASGVST